MHNKNFKKLLALTALTAFGLTACDDVEAKPSNDGSKIIEFKDSGDVFGNVNDTINDTIHGNLPSNVLDEILFTYSVSVAGPYNAAVAKAYAKNIQIDGKEVDPSTLITLEDVVNDHSKVADFVKVYKVYAADSEEKELEYINARYDAITKKVAETMYSKANSDSYKTHSLFNERDFLISLYSTGKKVANPYSDSLVSVHDYLVTPALEAEDVFTEDGFLTLANYTGSEGVSYIEDEILPDIYRDILVQQYIFDVQPNLLGSSYARKVNILSIAYDDIKTSLFAEKLMKGFVTNVLLNNELTDVLESFKMVSNIWNGEFFNVDNSRLETADEVQDEIQDTTEWAFLSQVFDDEFLALNSDSISQFIDSRYNGGETKYFFTGSAYGDLVEDYAKTNDNPDLAKNTTDYTGGNKYVKELGFKYESDKIKLNDHTNNGWFVKSSSEVSSLPEAIKNRLYNLAVATGINSNSSSTLSQDDQGVWKDEGTNKFITKFDYGDGSEHDYKYFLRSGTRKNNAEEYEDILFNDTSSHTYYVINVEQAVSTNYMNNTNVDWDTKIAVASLLSTNDTNVTLAKKHWLEKCDITYHDQSVYDYFETNYPELFED